MYLKVLSLYETLISIYTVLYDLNGAIVMTQTGPIISVCCNICIPNRHTYLLFVDQVICIQIYDVTTKGLLSNPQQ